MKKLILTASAALAGLLAGAQCTTTNATSCQCDSAASTNCDLLPDIQASEYAFQTYMGGPNEYPQQNAGTSVTAQGPDDGRLRISASTPNVGRGALEVRGVGANGYRYFMCGNQLDSIYDPNATQTFTCPNGDPNPHQVLKQRVYHKNGNTMQYYERFAGSMTYHPSHGHYHVDDWERMTLRIQDPNEPNPLNWPIVGTGIKVGFCVEDYQSCSTANGHCTDTAGNTLTNAQIVNFNMGGGNYGCGNVVQGITTGYTDIYWETLDGQWIDIPPGTCNGQYYVIIEVDPQNFWLESDKSNNWFASPITLTQQSPAGNPVIEITSDNPHTTICQGDSITLSATAGSSMLWSDGSTHQTIRVPSTTATYTCTVTNPCGTGTATFHVSEVPVVTPTNVTGDTICPNGNAVLTATGTGTLTWYDGNGNVVGSGSNFTTPTLAATTTYYVSNSDVHNDTAFALPHTNEYGAGDWKQSDQYEIFDALVPMNIVSVKVYAQNSGNRTFYLKDNAGNTITSATVNVPDGLSRVTLNFNSIPVGTNYRLGVNATTGNLNLYRNNSSRISYPYGVDGICKITGSSGGASYYYYGYDWEITTTQATCESPTVAAVATVNTCTGSGQNFAFQSSINVFPNPSVGGLFTVNFEAAHSDNIQFVVRDIVGQTVYNQNVTFSGKYSKELNLSSLSKGVYMFTITYEGKPYTSRLIIQ